MLEIKNVSKKYKKKMALDNFSYKLGEGRVLGLLGPNGSGKTTLMKLIQGYLKPTSGEIIFYGSPVDYRSKADISYLPDSPFIPEDYKIEEAIKLYRTFFEDFDDKKAEKLLKFMDLTEDMKVGTLSKGMKEKLHLSLILSRNAKLYIIDEPISGVDLLTRDKIIDAIVENINEKSSMIITTHLVDNLEKIFDEVIFISHKGQILESGDAEELRETYGMQINEIYRKVFGEVNA
ncbi:MAG: ABC transporter ATP-binding protein [Tissierellia bacterium]|nr:ABC transporter ATP-binding protein [Tissierellia bacterium]